MSPLEFSSPDDRPPQARTLTLTLISPEPRPYSQHAPNEHQATLHYPYPLNLCPPWPHWPGPLRIIVLPSWLHKDLRLAEGAAVKAGPSSLPPCCCPCGSTPHTVPSNVNCAPLPPMKAIFISSSPTYHSLTLPSSSPIAPYLVPCLVPHRPHPPQVRCVPLEQAIGVRLAPHSQAYLNPNP